MSLNKTLSIILFFTVSMSFAEVKKVDVLFEKIDQSSNPQEKKELIEKLKKKLAKENKKAQEEADAIIKAKEKMPQRLYKDVLVK